MTDLLFDVNGVDCSALVHKYGYQTESVPVWSRTVTTLDKREIKKLMRRRGVLTVKLNDAPEEQVAAFFAAMRTMPATVGYHRFQTGSDVTQTMTTDSAPLALLLKDGDTRWLEGFTMTFEEV